MSRVGAQEFERFINRLSFVHFEPGIVFNEDDFEVEFEERNFRGH